MRHLGRKDQDLTLLFPPIWKAFNIQLKIGVLPSGRSVNRKSRLRRNWQLGLSTASYYQHLLKPQRTKKCVCVLNATSLDCTQ